MLEYDGKYFEVEFVDNDGDTIDVLTTPIDVLELVHLNENLRDKN